MGKRVSRWGASQSSHSRVAEGVAALEQNNGRGEQENAHNVARDGGKMVARTSPAV